MTHTTQLENKIYSFMNKNGLSYLRVSLGIIYLWFGALKFFHGLSPAEGLALTTIDVLTFGLVPGAIAIKILAVWEVLIGFGMIFGVYMRFVILLMFAQMIGAFAPLVLFPEITFTRFPYAFTIEGQYILKNLLIISAGLILGSKAYGDENKTLKT